jgi:hypothetical protein
VSFQTGTVTELLYASTAAGATLASFTTEAQLNTTATMGTQAHLPPDFWLPNQMQNGRGIRIVARGVLGSTGTPTFTFTVRGGSATNVASTPIIVGTAALTLATTLTAVVWELQADCIMSSIGAAGANSTLRSTGVLTVGGIAASAWPAWGGASSPGTVASVDTSTTNYINVNAACGTSNAANTVTLNQLLVYGLN